MECMSASGMRAPCAPKLFAPSHSDHDARFDALLPVRAVLVSVTPDDVCASAATVTPGRSSTCG